MVPTFAGSVFLPMTDYALPAYVRQLLPETYAFASWADLAAFFEELLARPLASAADLRQWFADRSELESYLSEDFAWRYIRMTRDTDDEAATEAFHFFNENIQPAWAEVSNELDKKALASPFLGQLTDEGFAVLIRGMKQQMALFRQENIPVNTRIQALQSRYGAIAGAMAVTLEGREMTLQAAADELLLPDRPRRERAWRAIWERRFEDKTQLDDLLTELITLRHEVAQNAGYANFRDYMFASLGRFDYTVQDTFDFHAAVAATVVPMLSTLAAERRDELGVAELRPWDRAVDTSGQPPLLPFTGGDDLLEKTVEVFRRLDPELARYLRVMQQMGRFDLESRRGKAPGGYNYPLEESLSLIHI